MQVRAWEGGVWEEEVWEEEASETSSERLLERFISTWTLNIEFKTEKRLETIDNRD